MKIGEIRPDSLADVAADLTCCVSRLEALSGVTAPKGADLVSRAGRLYSARRRRSAHFDDGLFGEPAWDLLLDLFIHAEQSKSCSVSSATIGAAVPPTTALRHLVDLTDLGYIARTPDQNDRRRSFVTLTPLAMAKMRAYLLSLTD